MKAKRFYIAIPCESPPWLFVAQDQGRPVAVATSLRRLRSEMAEYTSSSYRVVMADEVVAPGKLDKGLPKI